MAFLRHGAMYFSTPAETTLGVDTPAKAAGTTTALTLSGFTHTTNRLTCTETISRVYQITAAVGATKGSGAPTVGTFEVRKNGNATDGSLMKRSITTSDEGVIIVATQVALISGDYIELWVATLNGDELTVEHGTITANSVG